MYGECSVEDFLVGFAPTLLVHRLLLWLTSTQELSVNVRTYLCIYVGICMSVRPLLTTLCYLTRTYGFLSGLALRTTLVVV